MGRLNRPDEGFTLLELVIAISLSAVVLLAASNLLVNFGKFSANVVKSESSLMGTALGSFEEMCATITRANQVTIPATNFAAPSIDVRVSEAGSGASSVHTNDVFHTYWMTGGKLYYKNNIGAPPPAAGAGTVIAGDINLLSFTRPDADLNKVTVTLGAQAASGAKGATSKEHLVTTVIMRSRSAN